VVNIQVYFSLLESFARMFNFLFFTANINLRVVLNYDLSVESAVKVDVRQFMKRNQHRLMRTPNVFVDSPSLVQYPLSAVHNNGVRSIQTC